MEVNIFLFLVIFHMMYGIFIKMKYW
jgi:hypothetical protein